jgi:Iron-containing redox enzyme
LLRYSANTAQQRAVEWLLPAESVLLLTPSDDDAGRHALCTKGADVMTIDLVTTLDRADAADQRAPHDPPAQLPPPRGPLTSSLLNYLLRDPARTRINPARLTWSGATTEATTDHDLQLALWLAYELHYRGLAGVDDAWEWHSGLVEVISEWEALMLDALSSITDGPWVSVEPGALAPRLFELVAADGRPSLSETLMRDATVDQFREFLVHRAMVTIQADEYGSGGTGAMYAQLFRSLLADWGLATRYGHYVGCLPGVTLLTSNLMSMFGLNRRFRGALVGHLAMFEMTSSMTNARCARGHRRLGGSDGAARFFDEHVVADAAHGQIAAYDLAEGLAAAEPRLSDDILFGARCAAYADEQFAAWVLPRWAAGQSSLLRGIDE